MPKHEGSKERERAEHDGDEYMTSPEHMHHRLKRIEMHVGLPEYDPAEHGPKNEQNEDREESHAKGLHRMGNARKRS